MISARIRLFAALVLLFSSAAYADNAPVSHDVPKADGTVGRYQFLPVHHDPAHEMVVKQRLQSLTSVNSKALPATYRIPADLLPTVRDQGQRGTCAYFATVGLMDAYYMTQSSANKTISISPECLVDVRNWEYDQAAQYTGSDKPDQRPDPNGDLPNSIVKTVQANGVPLTAKYTQADCRYDGAGGGSVSLTDYTTIFTSGQSKAWGKGMTFDQNTAPTIDSIKAQIAANHPVEVGILVYNEYFSGPNWRYNEMNDTDDNLAGGHAIQLIGYATDGDQTIFTFKNSWGPTWGVNGYGTLDDKLLSHGWGYDATFDFTVSLH